MHETTLQRTVAPVIFAAAYMGLGLGRWPGLRVDRTGVAIIGGTLMVLTGVLPWNEAVRAVDAHTLVLLFGMMVVAAYLRLSGFFSLVTLWAIQRAKTPRTVLAAVIGAAGILSALFVNDLVCLVLAPLVVDVTRRLALPPVPYLMALATAANVGSVATLNGQPAEYARRELLCLELPRVPRARRSRRPPRARLRLCRGLVHLPTRDAELDPA